MRTDYFAVVVIANEEFVLDEKRCLVDISVRAFIVGEEVT